MHAVITFLELFRTQLCTIKLQSLSTVFLNINFSTLQNLKSCKYTMTTPINSKFYKGVTSMLYNISIVIIQFLLFTRRTLSIFYGSYSKPNYRCGHLVLHSIVMNLLIILKYKMKMTSEHLTVNIHTWLYLIRHRGSLLQNGRD